MSKKINLHKATKGERRRKLTYLIEDAISNDPLWGITCASYQEDDDTLVVQLGSKNKYKITISGE